MTLVLGNVLIYTAIVGLKMEINDEALHGKSRTRNGSWATQPISALTTEIPSFNANQRPRSERRYWPTTRYGYLVAGWFIAIHALAIAGLVIFPFPGWRVFLAASVLAFLGGASVTICYHRSVAHQSLRLHPVVREIFTLLAMLSGASAPGSWIPAHRRHHATTDTPNDPSSPKWGGLFWAHFGWIYQTPAAPPKYTLASERSYFQRWGRLQIPLLAVALAIGALFGAAAFFWLGAVRLVFCFHGTALVNSVCHTRPGTPPGMDASRNVGWVGLMQFGIGECWHQNHHAYPGSARLGWTWREPDLGYLLILALEKLRLASAVHRSRGPVHCDRPGTPLMSPNGTPPRLRNYE